MVGEDLSLIGTGRNLIVHTHHLITEEHLRDTAFAAILNGRVL